MKIITLMEDTCGRLDCVYEHGLSVYIETGKHCILVDTGASDGFIQNASKLSIDLKKVDTVILSHGHYDHSGGLMAFMALNPNAQIYMQRTASLDYYHADRYIGIDKAILNHSQVHLLDGDYRLDDELSLFTNITGRKFFARGNLILSKMEGNTLYPDDFVHEQCLVIESEGKKILLSGCAHNGMINILERYEAIYHTTPDYVISGFHMYRKNGYEEEDLEMMKETAKILSTYQTIFYTGHCTGEKAIGIMKPIMGEKLHTIHTGLEITLE